MGTHDIAGLIAVLEDVAAALQRPGNDFVWSCWDDGIDASAEIDGFIARLRTSSIVDRSRLKFLFLPTGPLQDVSLSSGWEAEFLILAERFDAEFDRTVPGWIAVASDLMRHLPALRTIALRRLSRP